ncbi:MAG: S46 family peptidase [Flavobacteriia bacterium]
MKKITISFLFSITFLFSFAEEGMLIPSLLAAFESDMQAKGMKLTAEQIYSVNHSSIKDAIIHFGGGCTAEIVSKQGLLLTNHHCGYSQIQSHSSLEKDYLKNGFWAKNYGEELANVGLTASRMVRIDDVTSTMLFGIKESDDASVKNTQLKKNMEQLIKDAKVGNHYEAEIKAFNYGNNYYIIVKEVFLDVRLVGTPPNSIGKFGGDTDNWVWPRHTGDFSVFRIYAGKDNKPATYAADNVPYSPIHSLPISFKNRKEGDFTMVYGFPGQTEQHLVSGQIKYIVDKERPARIKMRELSLSVIDEAMRNSDAVRIKYSAKQASIANAYKKWIGQIGGLKELGALDKKEKYETDYIAKAFTKEEYKKYLPLVKQMNDLIASDSKYDFEYQMGIEYLYVGPELFDIGRAIDDIIKNFPTWVKNNEVKTKIEELKRNAEGFFKDYDENVDKKIFQLQTEEYRKQLNIIDKTFALDLKTNLIYSKSILTNKDRYLAFLNKLSEKSLKKLSKDPGYSYYTQVNDNFVNNAVPKYREFNAKMTSLLKTYVAGKYEMFPDAKHWADANSTLRVTYGKLEGSAPTDGMKYTEHTTLGGIIQKYNTGNPDFELLPRMLELAANKQYGNYGQDGELWVCFTGSNHTTGGNSGSPVLDENGYLMGLNFDRTWESTMSDYLFDPTRCRNVVVDIRYVLWVMDIYSDAKHLVDEMELKKQ